MNDLFPETKPPRAKPRVMAHVIDAGCSCETMLARFECPRCRWESEWLPVSSVSDSKSKRGIPCPVCNQMSRANRDLAAALAASVSAQRAAKAESERIEQEKRNEPIPIKLELDGQNTSNQPRRIWIKPE